MASQATQYRHASRRVWTAGLAAALAVAVGSCAAPPAGGSGGGPGNPRPETAQPRPTSAGGGTTVPKPDETTGDVDARIVGNDQISCDAIDAEVEIVAQGGEARWTASAKRSPTFADRAAAPGVRLSPTEGELAEGKSAVIRVQGSFDKRNKYFYVFVATPNRSGAAGRGLEFKCRA